MVGSLQEVLYENGETINMVQGGEEEEMNSWALNLRHLSCV